MIILNKYTSELDDIKDGLSGPWGKDIDENGSVYYLGNIVIVIVKTSFEKIKVKCEITNKIELTDNVYLCERR